MPPSPFLGVDTNYVVNSSRGLILALTVDTHIIGGYESFSARFLLVQIAPCGNLGAGGHAHVELLAPYPVPHVLSPYVTTTESCRGGRGQGQALARRERATSTTSATADVARPAR